MKKAFLTAIVILSVILAAAIAAPFFIDINRFRGPILEAAQSKLGRGVEAGRISWNLLPSLTVRLDNVVLHEGPDCSSPTIFKANAIEVMLRWAPLLAKEVEIGSVVLTGPSVFVIKKKDGQVMVEATDEEGKMLKSAPPSSPSPARGEGTIPSSSKKGVDMQHFRLGRLEVVDGTVEWRDESREGGRVIKVNKLLLDVSNIALDEKVRFNSSAVLGDSGLPVSLRGWFGPVSREMLDHAQWGMVSSEIHLVADGMDLEGARTLWGTSDLGGLSGKADLDLTVSHDADNTSFSLDFRGDEMALRIPGQLRKPTGEILRVKTSGKVQGSKIMVEQANIKIASSKITLSRSSYDMKSHDFEVALQADFALESLLPWMDQKVDAVASGSASAHVNLSGNTDRLRDVQADGTVDLNSVRLSWPGVLARGVEAKGSIEIRQDLLQLRGLEWKIGKSNLRLDGKVGMKADAPGQISLESDYLDVEELMSLFVREDKEVASKGNSGTHSRFMKPNRGMSRNSPDSPPLKALPVSGDAPSGKSGTHSRFMKPNRGMSLNSPHSAKWAFEGDCKITTLVFHRNRLADVRGRVIFDGDVLTLSKFTASCFQGGLSTAVQVDLHDPETSFRWGIRTTDIQINDVVEANSDFGQRIFGRLNTQMELTGRANGGLDALLASLEGTGTVEVKDMRLATFNMMDQLSMITGLLGIKQEGFDETRFERFATQVQLRGGRVFTSNVQANGNNFDLTGNGSFGFDRMLDYDLQVRLNKQVTARLGKGELVQSLLDPDGTVQIPFAIQGRLDGPPRFMPRWDSILAQRATEYLAKKLFKRKSSQPQEEQQQQTGSSTVQQDQPTEPTLEDLLKQILKK